MNGSLQPANFQMPSAHLASLLQQHDTGGHAAALQNLQKSAALQQLAYQSSLYAAPPPAGQSPVGLSPPSQSPFSTTSSASSNLAHAAATAAALFATHNNAGRMPRGHPSDPPHALAASPQHQQHLLERLVDASHLQSQIQAAAAAAALQSAQAQSLLQAHALNAHKAQAMYQAAAAAVAACSGAPNPLMDPYPPPVSSAPSPFPTTPQQPSALATSPPVWPPRTPPHAPAPPLDPQAAALSSLLSNLLPSDPLPPHPAATPPFLNPSHLTQANLAAAAAANPALARALSLPPTFSPQDPLARAAAASQAAFAAAQSGAAGRAPAHHVPQRATWHAQRPLPSAASAPPPRNSLDVRPASHAAAGHPLHLHHVGITHAGSSTRAIPTITGPKPPSTPPLGQPPLTPTLPPRGGSPQPKGDGSSGGGPSAAAVASLAKLITQAGIVAGRKKATPGNSATGGEGSEDTAVKEEFKQQILVQVGEKLAQAGYTVDEAVKAGLLGGMYVGEVRILCSAHKAECERLAAGGTIPPEAPEGDSSTAPAAAAPGELGVEPLAAMVAAAGGEGGAKGAALAAADGGAAVVSPFSALAEVAGGLPDGGAWGAPLEAEAGGLAGPGGRAHSAPAAGMFDAFSYSFFGSMGSGSGIGAGTSEGMLLEELEEGEGEGELEGLEGGWSMPEGPGGARGGAEEGGEGKGLQQQMSALAV